MSFRLDPRHAFAPQVRSLLLEQCCDALTAVRGAGADAVHDIRRCGKRSRALLRLARPGLPRRAFKRLNRAWRDVGRRLSTMRDHAVLAHSLGRLAKRYPDVLAPAVLQQIRQRLTRSATPLATVRSSLGKALTGLYDDLRHAEISPRWRDAARGHARCHADCLAARKKAARHGRAEDRHTWRKRVKDLDLQMHLFASLWPGMTTAWGDLAEVLGQEHDLVLLRRWLAQSCDVPRSIQVRRQAHRWQRHLRALGDHLADELPDDPERTRLQVLGARQAVA